MKAKAAKSRTQKMTAGTKSKKKAVKKTAKTAKSRVKVSVKKASTKAQNAKTETQKLPKAPGVKESFMNPPPSEMKREQRFKEEAKKARTRPQFTH